MNLFSTALFSGLFAAGVSAVMLTCQVDPRATAPTPDNPCGNIGVVCLDMQGQRSGYCCDEGETCGGGKFSVGCPAGYCCDIRMPPTFSVKHAASDAGGGR